MQCKGNVTLPFVNVDFNFPLIWNSCKFAFEDASSWRYFFIFVYFSEWCWSALHLHPQPLHLLIVLSSSAALYVNLDAECTFMSLPALLETVPALQYLQNFFQLFNVKATFFMLNLLLGSLICRHHICCSVTVCYPPNVSIFSKARLRQQDF